MTNALFTDLFSYQYSEIVVGVIFLIIMMILWKYVLNRPLWDGHLPGFLNIDANAILMLFPDNSFDDGKSFLKYFNESIIPTFGDKPVNVSGLTGEFSKTTSKIVKTCLENNCTVSLITGPSLPEDRFNEAKNLIGDEKYKNKLKMFVSKNREDCHFILFNNYLYAQYPHAHGTERNPGLGKKVGKYSLTKYIYTHRFKNIKKDEIKEIADINSYIKVAPNK